MKFSIITPTIIRKTLIDTCESIDSQKYKDMQHIVMIDRAEALLTEEKRNILKQTEADHREYHYTGKIDHLNDYGNKAKDMAYQFITGDYVLAMDDDDIFINNAFEKLEYFIKQENYPDLVIFPALRYGERFFNNPAGRTKTTSHQICYKPKFDNTEWRFGVSMEYEQDGIFLERMLHSKGVVRYFACPEELVETKVMSRGL